MAEARPGVAGDSGCVDPLAEWDGVPVATLRSEWGVPRLVVCASVGSTNDLAHALAREGCAAGTCVIAEAQTAGRGRQARRWSSPPGLGIWMSIVLRPAAGSDPGAVPLLAGLAVARAADAFCGGAARVKWPNDVLVGGRKLAGVLCEAVWEGERPGVMVVGIGINALHDASDFPPDLRQVATSLRIAGGAAPRRTEVAGEVVRALLASAAAPALDPHVLAELRRRDALLGQRVVVEGAAERPLRGTADGIDRDGSLRLRLEDGGVRRIRSGTVRSAAHDGAPAAAPLAR